MLARRSFALVLASPMRRSLETARLAGFTSPAVREEIREWDYGDYEGRTTAAIRREVPEWTVFTHPVPGGETIGTVAARIDRIIAETRATPATYSSSATHTRSACSARAGAGSPALYGRNLALQAASVSVLTYERETPVLGQWDWLPELA